MRDLEEAHAAMVPGVANRVLAGKMQAVLAIGEDCIRPLCRGFMPGPRLDHGCTPSGPLKAANLNLAGKAGFPWCGCFQPDRSH